MGTNGTSHHHDLLGLVRFTEDGIHSQVLGKSESFSCALLCLSKGNRIDTHESTGKACIQVLKGSGVLAAESERHSLRAGSFIFLPERLPHSIEAGEDLAFLLCLSHLIPPELYRLRHR